MQKNVAITGYWAALLSLLFALGYCVPQLISAFNLIPHPHEQFWLFLPSLFQAPAFLVTMVCLHYPAPDNLKLWTAIAWSFAILYCLCVTLVYFTQLTVLLPARLAGKMNDENVLIFEPRTFLTAVDCLGYFYMSLSTLFAAFAFRQVNKWLYRGLLWNGLLLPILILAFFYPVFYYVGALWMITFPMAMIQAAKIFRKQLKE